MAKKRTTARPEGAPRKKRIRRSPEEIISDLQEEIERLRTKAAAKALKKSPAVKLALTSLRTIDKGLDEAASEQNSPLRHAFADARKSLAAFLEKQGVRLPKARLPKGPRPKEE